MLVYSRLCRDVMHFWRVLLELGKLCAFFVLHWLGGRVWVVSQLAGVNGMVRLWEANIQMFHTHSLQKQIYPP